MDDVSWYNFKWLDFHAPISRKRNFIQEIKLNGSNFIATYISKLQTAGITFILFTKCNVLKSIMEALEDFRTFILQNTPSSFNEPKEDNQKEYVK